MYSLFVQDREHDIVNQEYKDIKSRIGSHTSRHHLSYTLRRKSAAGDAHPPWTNPFSYVRPPEGMRICPCPVATQSERAQQSRTCYKGSRLIWDHEHNHAYPFGMIQYTIRSEVVLCPTEQPPQKNSIAQYSMVLDNVMTADANPITGADGYDDMCAKYT